MIALLAHEKEVWNRGVRRVCGIDEAGRGPLAGPVVAAAVVLPRDFEHPTLTDSKKLTPKMRERIYTELTTHPAIEWSVASISAPEIDELDILRATWKAMVTARDGLKTPPDWTLVDGLRVPPLGEAQTPLVGGDSRSWSIAAASVLAKVTRDRWMTEAEAAHPGYGFARHKGYGTAAHLEALRQLGPCPIHRRSFAPVRDALVSPK